MPWMIEACNFSEYLVRCVTLGWRWTLCISNTSNVYKSVSWKVRTRESADCLNVIVRSVRMFNESQNHATVGIYLQLFSRGYFKPCFFKFLELKYLLLNILSFFYFLDHCLRCSFLQSVNLLESMLVYRVI